jgi:hypothetical protein
LDQEKVGDGLDGWHGDSTRTIQDGGMATAR